MGRKAGMTEKGENDGVREVLSLSIPAPFRLRAVGCGDFRKLLIYSPKLAFTPAAGLV